MKHAVWSIASIALFISQLQIAAAQKSEQPSAKQFELSSKGIEPPVVLCIDDKPGIGADPSSQAYAKAAKNGFRSVLTLRSTKDGVDIVRERFMVEQNKLRYFNISATANLPRREQVDEFLKLARDPANHPMLINCAFAERIAPFMMMFRVIEQGWNEEKAIEEASKSGLQASKLKPFLKSYLSRKHSKEG